VKLKKFPGLKTRMELIENFLAYTYIIYKRMIFPIIQKLREIERTCIPRNLIKIPKTILVMKGFKD